MAKKKTTHDPGGKVRLKVSAGIQSSAVFGGSNHEYRYQLIRTWDATKPSVLFVMMNPSVADLEANDPTVGRCFAWAVHHGFGTLLVGNVFAYRATQRERLLEVTDPIGPDNDRHLVMMARQAELIVFAYGQPHRTLLDRGPAVAQLIANTLKRPVHVLKLSKAGIPWHPLYLKRETVAIPWLA